MKIVGKTLALSCVALAVGCAGSAFGDTPALGASEIRLGSSTAAKVKPLGGVNSGPKVGYGIYANTKTYDNKTGPSVYIDGTDLYSQLAPQYVRLHDVEFPFGHNRFIDVHCYLEDTSAGHARYFSDSDAYVDSILAASPRAKIIFRLGESIAFTPQINPYAVRPSDYAAWSQAACEIAEHYIAKYPEVPWYFEIWNEPELDSGRQFATAPNVDPGAQSINGTAPYADYVNLYKVAAKALGALQAKYPNCTVKVGPAGFSGGGGGKLQSILEAIKGDAAIPLDFIDIHHYSTEPATMVNGARNDRTILDKFNRKSVEIILGEWNVFAEFNGQGSGTGVNKFAQWSGKKGGSLMLKHLIAYQGCDAIDAATFYDAQFSGYWNILWYKPYNTFCDVQMTDGYNGSDWWNIYGAAQLAVFFKFGQTDYSDVTSEKLAIFNDAWLKEYDKSFARILNDHDKNDASFSVFDAPTPLSGFYALKFFRTLYDLGTVASLERGVSVSSGVSALAATDGKGRAAVALVNCGSSGWSGCVSAPSGGYSSVRITKAVGGAGFEAATCTGGEKVDYGGESVAVSLDACQMALVEFEGGVAEPQPLVPSDPKYAGVRVLKNEKYGERANLSNEGAGYVDPANPQFPSSRDEWGNPCNTHETGQTYDLYYPARFDEKSPIFLFVHGGAYVCNLDKGLLGDASAAPIVYDLVQNKGAIVYAMNYIMPQDYISYPPPTVVTPSQSATIGDMVKDVDLMVSQIKADAAKRGFNADRLILWGESAGAHLVSLYAYDEKTPAQMGLGLRHDLPVKVVLNMAGPVDLSESCGWRSLAAENQMLLLLFQLVAGGDTAKYDSSTLVTEGSTPTVLCYNQLQGQVHDTLIPVAQYDKLKAALETFGVPLEAKLFTQAHGMDLYAETSRNWAIDAALSLLERPQPTPVVSELPTDMPKGATEIESGEIAGIAWTDAAASWKLGNGDAVIVFTNVAAGTFTVDAGKTATVDYLAVGGGGAGGVGAGEAWKPYVVGDGGAAGAAVAGDELAVVAGTYTVVVGAGGSGSAGGESSLKSATGSALFAADGGAMGLSPKGQKYGFGGDGASAPGGAPYTPPPEEVPGAVWIGGAGGAGKAFDINGVSVVYAGGGAGGSTGYYGTDPVKEAFGGVGGGGDSRLAPDGTKFAGNGVDSLGAGGAGAGAWGDSSGLYSFPAPGKGGNGVVIIRVTKVADGGVIPIGPGGKSAPYDTKEAAEADLCNAEFVPSAEVEEKLGVVPGALDGYKAKFRFAVVPEDGKWVIAAELKPEAQEELLESADQATRQIPLTKIAALQEGSDPVVATVTDCVPGFYYTLYDGSEVTDIEVDSNPKNRDIICGTDEKVTFPEVAKPSAEKGFFSVGAQETRVDASK